jgi:hypothetical protein
MPLMILQYLSVLILITTLIFVGPVVNATAAVEDVPRGHTMITGVVTEKSGRLAVTTATGAVHQLNANMSRRHGHEPFKAGDEVIAVLDENNYIVDMHLKGEEGKHQLVTGKLIHVGLMKNQIKLQTPEGEKVFPLAEQGLKTKGIPDGALVTIELNEAGAVIDLHRSDSGSVKK